MLKTKEKEFTRQRDALAAERRRLPMVLVEKDYQFEGPVGGVGLLDLFDGRRQLIVYGFFFEPGVARWPEAGCGGCSMFVDNVGHLAHLRHLPGARLPRAAARHRAIRETHGGDGPVVHHHRRLLEGLPEQ